MKPAEYQKTGKFFAQVAGSLETLANEELQSLGATVLQQIPRGLRFAADLPTLYRIVYCSRLLQRILAPLISFQCHSEKYLYKQAFGSFDFTELFSPDNSFGIECNVSHSKINHSLYAAQLLKDAICDQFRAKYNRRPDFSANDADLVLNLHIKDNLATISLDLTGISMHKRGYRSASSAAPLQETLAAAIVKLSGWDGQYPLCDPMCGSGSILAEALMMWCQIPAGFLRKDRGISFLPDYDQHLDEEIRRIANSAIRKLPKGLIMGSDIDPLAVQIAKTSLAALPGAENVKLSVMNFQFLPPMPKHCFITNPPYGKRLGAADSIKTLYNDLGDFLKQRCEGSVAYILGGNDELISALRLRAYWKKSLKNADLDVKLAKILIRGREKRDGDKSIINQNLTKNN